MSVPENGGITKFALVAIQKQFDFGWFGPDFRKPPIYGFSQLFMVRSPSFKTPQVVVVPQFVSKVGANTFNNVWVYSRYIELGTMVYRSIYRHITIYLSTYMYRYNIRTYCNAFGGFWRGVWPYIYIYTYLYIYTHTHTYFSNFSWLHHWILKFENPRDDPLRLPGSEPSLRITWPAAVQCCRAIGSIPASAAYGRRGWWMW